MVIIFLDAEGMRRLEAIAHLAVSVALPKELTSMTASINLRHARRRQ